MADLSRVRVELGSSGVTGPGVMTFYTTGSGASLTTAVKNWLTNMSNMFPPALTFIFPTGGEQIDSTTGDLTGAWTGGPGGTLVGSATAPSYAQGVGIRVVWNTGTVSNNRRVRGSTFLVPLATSQFTSGGGLSPSAQTDITTKTTAFITAATGAFTVWSRPTATRAGGTASITSCTIPTAVSWLTTRRR